MDKEYRFDTFSFRGTRVASPKITGNPNIEFIDAEAVKEGLTLRAWQNGDWFIPLGMREHKKLSDFFVDEKVPLPDKGLIPILFSGDMVVWVCGKRLDDRFKITPKTTEFLRLEFQPHQNGRWMNKVLNLNGDCFVPFLSEEKIQARVKQLANQINKDYKGGTPIFIGILNGAFLFMADLIRHITLDCEIDFLKLSSYGDVKISSGNVHLLKDLNCQVAGRDILVVEDIIDTGLSIDFMKKLIMAHNPRSLRIISLLYKKDSLKIDVKIDYIGFSIPNFFVIGYGLDYAQKVRNLRSIYRLEEKKK